MTQVHLLPYLGGCQGDKKEGTGSGDISSDCTAAVLHGSPRFSLSVLIICVGEGMAQRADDVQTHPGLDVSQTQRHCQNQSVAVSLVPSLFGVQSHGSPPPNPDFSLLPQQCFQ